MRKGARLAALVSILMAVAAPAWAGGPFANWAAVVVAGDWRAHDGGPTEAFDNARRDVAAMLPKLGFSADNVRQFSTKPDQYPDTHPARADLESIYTALTQMEQAGANAGCFVYYTSHGGPGGSMVDRTGHEVYIPAGVVLDQDGEAAVLTPQVLGEVIDNACPDRPAIIVISACYSGMFLPILAENDRVILTAARADRSSFGCGAENKYPYFDDCFLQSARKSSNFAVLGPAVQECVHDMEIKTGARPPSEPQLWIGPALRPMLPLYSFPAKAGKTP